MPRRMLSAAICIGAAASAPAGGSWLDPAAGTVGNATMFSQKAKEAPEDGLSPTSLCPVENFKSSLKKVSAMLPGALEQAGGEEAVVSHYEKIPKGPQCVREHEESASWHKSKRHDKGLIINFGEGTTATRFLACVMDDLGYKTIHNDKELKECTNMEGTRSCADRWDKYDFIADTPVPKELSQLMATHHRLQGAAAYMLSLRDPAEWAKSRVGHHLPLSKSWTQTSICGDPTNLLVNSKRVPLHKLVYDSFAHCLTTSERYGSAEEHLFMFNLFESDDVEASNRKFANNLHTFLNRDNHHGAVPTSKLTHEKISRSVTTCSHSHGYREES